MCSLYDGHSKVVAIYIDGRLGFVVTIYYVYILPFCQQSQPYGIVIECANESGSLPDFLYRIVLTPDKGGERAEAQR